MPLTIPTRKGVVDSLRNYFSNEMPTVDPSTWRRSWIGGLVKALGSALADWYIALKRLVDREFFPQTATGDFLRQGWWVDITKLQPLPAAPAHGSVVVEGEPGTAIAAGTEMAGTGVTYVALMSNTITRQIFAATSLTPNADKGIAVFETSSAHNLATGQTVTVSGASPSAYNGTFEIVVIDETSFSYEPDTLPGSSATGSPLATTDFALVLIEATTSGQATNIAAGGTLSITNAPAGADSAALVPFAEIAGGTDAETEDSFRARVMEALGTDYGMFSADEIEIVAKTVPGVTRVMIRKAQVSPAPGWPYEGQVKIAFLRDNDANPLPSAQEVADVKARILALEMPAHTAAEDVIVMSPPAYEVDFAFASITPDTPGMRRAIKASLQQYFKEQAQWGAEIPLLDLQCVIKDAFDLETRQKLKAFSLTSPSAAVTPGVDDYPVLGQITYG